MRNFLMSLYLRFALPSVALASPGGGQRLGINHYALALFVAIALPGLVIAGTGGAEFNTAYTTLTEWAEGDLGRLITAGLLITGLAMGIVRQSIMAAVPAIGAGLVFNTGPTVIDAIVGATI